MKGSWGGLSARQVKLLLLRGTGVKRGLGHLQESCRQP